MPSGVLFVHNNFPGQFRSLAEALTARGVACAAIGGPQAPGLAGIDIGRYGALPAPAPGAFPLAARVELDLRRGRAAADSARDLKTRGFDPQVIVGHTTWGETLFLAEVFPKARQVLYSEFYFSGPGLELGSYTEFHPPNDDSPFLLRSQNAGMAMALAQADIIVCPTAFQAAVLPTVFRAQARVVHEGVDVEAIHPAPPEPFALPNSRWIQPGTPVITHINNHMEPLRGLHILARALPKLLAEVPDAEVVIVGGPPGRPYGGPAPGGGSWRDLCFQGVDFDPARVHFLGKAAHPWMLSALRISTAHVYYTYPYVLSWSLLEAMASGCYVIGSDTAPVRDVIQDGVNGRLLPFGDVEALTDALIAACRNPDASGPLRAAARRTAVTRFSRTAGLAGWLSLLEEVGMAPSTPR